MYSSDFIKLRPLEGELIIYHKKQDLALTVSTQELVIQRPHMTYYVQLKDIVSILPYQPQNGRTVRFVSERSKAREIARLEGETGSYRFYVAKTILHSRSGLSELVKAEFVLPIAEILLDKIGQYGGFDQIHED